MALKETGRWLAKKAARRVTVFGSGHVRKIRGESGRTSVRVLTYHRFVDAERGRYSVPPVAFEEQMSWLSEQGLAVSLAQVERFVSGHDELKEGSILVTIDDSSLSAYTHAAPVLKRYNIPSVAYVATANVGKARSDYDTPEPCMTWDQLAELQESGIEIGSHGHSHRAFALLSEGEQRTEAERSKELLQARLGRECSSFSFPAGTRAHSSRTVRRVLRETGYRSAFTNVHGNLHTGMDALLLPRVKIEGGESLWMFQQMVQGGMDAWRFVDGTLAAVARARSLAG